MKITDKAILDALIHNKFIMRSSWPVNKRVSLDIDSQLQLHYYYTNNSVTRSGYIPGVLDIIAEDWEVFNEKAV